MARTDIGVITRTQPGLANNPQKGNWIYKKIQTKNFLHIEIGKCEGLNVIKIICTKKTGGCFWHIYIKTDYKETEVPGSPKWPNWDSSRPPLVQEQSLSNF